MTKYNEQEAMQGVTERFILVAEELHLSGPRLYREGVVANDQVLSKIKNGWQKPTPKAIELLCKKFNVSAVWMYTGEGPRYLGNTPPPEQRDELAEEKLFYKADFNNCLDSKGIPIPAVSSMPFVFPVATDIDFWCVNNDMSLIPDIIQGDIIALKRLTTWKQYIPGDLVCVVCTSEYKVLRKVSVSQPDEQCINFTQIVNGTPVEASIRKDIILEIYKVVGNYRSR